MSPSSRSSGASEGVPWKVQHHTCSHLQQRRRKASMRRRSCGSCWVWRRWSGIGLADASPTHGHACRITHRRGADIVLHHGERAALWERAQGKVSSKPGDGITKWDRVSQESHAWWGAAPWPTDGSPHHRIPCDHITSRFSATHRVRPGYRFRSSSRHWRKSDCALTACSCA